MSESTHSEDSEKVMLAEPGKLFARTCDEDGQTYKNPWLYMSLVAAKGALESLAYSKHQSYYGEPAHVALLGKRVRTARRLREAIHWLVWLAGCAFHAGTCYLYSRCYLVDMPRTCSTLCYFGLAASATVLVSALFFVYAYALLRLKRRLINARPVFLAGNVVTIILFCIVFAHITSKGVIDASTIVNATVVRYTVLVAPYVPDTSYICAASIYYCAVSQIALWCVVILVAGAVKAIK